MPPPLVPPEKACLDQELKLTGRYNLRNKHEVKLKVQLQLLRQVLLLFYLKPFIATRSNCLLQTGPLTQPIGLVTHDLLNNLKSVGASTSLELLAFRSLREAVKGTPII